ncbi:protein-tyrosine kinase 6-like [Scleropages formosus]|uniref:non-specific protein-tyrosine kinase n=1 Tax=Scleropages formosus TaxID=113540 RepID=A0A0P7TQQ3_SCLFO|nr:protein-tyrosine kinase 6-like [Scleropages formosus]
MTGVMSSFCTRLSQWFSTCCHKSSKSRNTDQNDKGSGGKDGPGPEDTESDSAQQGKKPQRLLSHGELLGQRSADGSDIYKALWKYDAREEQELSFHEGDRFKIAQRCGEWWTVERIDAFGISTGKGIVPRSYLAKEDTLEANPWYFGKLSRLETVANKAKHFKVYHPEENHWYIDETHCFSSLQDLVDYYRGHALTSVGQLGKPCVRRTPRPQDLSHSTVDEWELPKDQFVLEEKLGSGFFSDVYRGCWKGSVRVAVKVLKNMGSLNYKDFQMEIHIMKKLRHRNLLALFALSSTSQPYYIITELMEKGSLQDLLRGDEGASLDMPSLIDMAIQVANGMAYLESNNSIHRDLAARNVLVGEDYTCKVADFGLARVIKEPFYISWDVKIPYKWTAPEAISHGRFSIKSDVWSFGVLLYEIFTYGGNPYPALHNHEVYKLITSGYRMPSPSNCPDSIYEVMLFCWDLEPERRPSFGALTSSLIKANIIEVEQTGETCCGETGH